MSDPRCSPGIVERLRNARPWVGKLGMEAADEIERLRAVAQGSPDCGDAGAVEMQKRCAAMMDNRAEYFERAKGHRDWTDAARSYRASAVQIRSLPLPLSASPPSPVAGEDLGDLVNFNGRMVTWAEIENAVKEHKWNRGASVSSTDGSAP